MMKEVSFPLAFLAGVLSFLSPCVLPLVPSYVSFITGISFEDLREGADRKKIHFLTITNSLTFIAGFSTVFIALGASSSAVGRFFFEYQDWIRINGGVLVIFFGLFVSGVIRMDFLTRERKFHMTGKPAGYIGSFFVGMTFAAAWTPCIGPILGTILLYASSQGSAAYGFKLLAVYSLGLALPFFLSSLKPASERMATVSFQPSNSSGLTSTAAGAPFFVIGRKSGHRGPKHGQTGLVRY